jgi:hypothetical protein
MSNEIFNPKAHILLAAKEDAKSRERPTPETLLTLQAKFGKAPAAAKGHYKDPSKMALGHNKSNGPRRQ